MTCVDAYKKRNNIEQSTCGILIKISNYGHLKALRQLNVYKFKFLNSHLIINRYLSNFLKADIDLHDVQRFNSYPRENMLVP